MFYQSLLSAIVITCMCTHTSSQGTEKFVKKAKDLLCILALSGLYKEDLDDKTINLLSKHHVDLDNLRNSNFKKECLKETEYRTRRSDVGTINKSITNEDDKLNASVSLNDLININKEQIINKHTDNNTKYLDNKLKYEILNQADNTSGPEKPNLTKIYNDNQLNGIHNNIFHRNHMIENKNVSVIKIETSTNYNNQLEKEQDAYKMKVNVGQRIQSNNTKTTDSQLINADNKTNETFNNVNKTFVKISDINNNYGYKKTNDLLNAKNKNYLRTTEASTKKENINFKINIPELLNTVVNGHREPPDIEIKYEKQITNDKNVYFPKSNHFSRSTNKNKDYKLSDSRVVQLVKKLLASQVNLKNSDKHENQANIIEQLNQAIGNTANITYPTFIDIISSTEPFHTTTNSHLSNLQISEIQEQINKLISSQYATLRFLNATLSKPSGIVNSSSSMIPFKIFTSTLTNTRSTTVSTSGHTKYIDNVSNKITNVVKPEENLESVLFVPTTESLNDLIGINIPYVDNVKQASKEIILDTREIYNTSINTDQGTSEVKEESEIDIETKSFKSSFNDIFHQKLLKSFYNIPKEQNMYDNTNQTLLEYSVKNDNNHNVDFKSIQEEIQDNNYNTNVSQNNIMQIDYKDVINKTYDDANVPQARDIFNNTDIESSVKNKDINKKSNLMTDYLSKLNQAYEDMIKFQIHISTTDITTETTTEINTKQTTNEKNYENLGEEKLYEFTQNKDSWSKIFKKPQMASLLAKLLSNSNINIQNITRNIKENKFSQNRGLTNDQSGPIVFKNRSNQNINLNKNYNDDQSNPAIVEDTNNKYYDRVSNSNTFTNQNEAHQYKAAYFEYPPLPVIEYGPIFKPLSNNRFVSQIQNIPDNGNKDQTENNYGIPQITKMKFDENTSQKPSYFNLHQQYPYNLMQQRDNYQKFDGKNIELLKKVNFGNQREPQYNGELYTMENPAIDFKKFVITNKMQSDAAELMNYGNKIRHKDDITNQAELNYNDEKFLNKDNIPGNNLTEILSDACKLLRTSTTQTSDLLVKFCDNEFKKKMLTKTEPKEMFTDYENTNVGSNYQPDSSVPSARYQQLLANRNYEIQNMSNMESINPYVNYRYGATLIEDKKTYPAKVFNNQNKIEVTKPNTNAEKRKLFIDSTGMQEEIEQVKLKNRFDNNASTEKNIYNNQNVGEKDFKQEIVKDILKEIKAYFKINNDKVETPPLIKDLNIGLIQQDEYSTTLKAILEMTETTTTTLAPSTTTLSTITMPTLPTLNEVNQAISRMLQIFNQFKNINPNQNVNQFNVNPNQNVNQYRPNSIKSNLQKFPIYPAQIDVPPVMSQFAKPIVINGRSNLQPIYNVQARNNYNSRLTRKHSPYRDPSNVKRIQTNQRYVPPIMQTADDIYKDRQVIIVATKRPVQIKYKFNNLKERPHEQTKPPNEPIQRDLTRFKKIREEKENQTSDVDLLSRVVNFKGLSSVGTATRKPKKHHYFYKKEDKNNDNEGQTNKEDQIQPKWKHKRMYVEHENSGENKRLLVSPRLQVPLVKEPNKSDNHYNNFLKSQQKVNEMLESILSTRNQDRTIDDS